MSITKRGRFSGPEERELPSSLFFFFLLLAWVDTNNCALLRVFEIYYYYYRSFWVGSGVLHRR